MASLQANRPSRPRPAVEVERPPVERLAGSPQEDHRTGAEICVLAPWPIFTVTIERAPDEHDEIYFHAGGQGFWVARMIVSLGQAAILCGPFGGESGQVVKLLCEAEGLATQAIPAHKWNGGYVHDRRDGERREIAVMESPSLNRHEADDVYDAVLATGLRCRNVVLTGVKTDEMLPIEMFRRLAYDLDGNGATVVADLSGAALMAIEGGLEFLKVSHEELIAANFSADDKLGSLLDGMRKLRRQKARNVVISRAGEGALACLGDRIFEAKAPEFSAFDHTGADDSMTAALAVGRATGLSSEDALKLAVAAGALNVTRHGRGTGEAQHIVELARHVDLTELS